MNPYAIRTQTLTRDFGSVRAVNSLDLEIPTGTVFGFLGPNGSGKTTTIRLLLGLLEPNIGHAEVLGFDTRKDAEKIRERCGALLEYSGLYERLSAEDNLQFYGRVWHMPVSERQARIKELLTETGLYERRKEVVHDWSRGMKQKLAIARAIFHRPALIFLDEPTAGLDPVAAVALREDLSALAQREGVTIFLTTHNLAEAEKLCQQVGVIRQGKLLAVGPIEKLREQSGSARVNIVGRGFSPELLEQLKSRPEVRSIRYQNGNISLELNGAVEVAPLVRLLVTSGADVEEVCKEKVNLEEMFLALVGEDENGAGGGK
jgi:ABC-2 type transport system ATP-binding protein